MRNKKSLLMGIFALLLTPFLAFSVAFAVVDDSGNDSTDDNATPTVTSENPTDDSSGPSVKSPRQPLRPVLERMKSSDDDDSDDDSSSSQRKKGNSDDRVGAVEKMREVKVKTMKRIMTNQIERATKALDRMQQIIERIEARRAKLDSSTADLTQVDALIAKAKTQKTEAATALEKAKADWAALEVTTTDPATSVKTFMASMKDLKTKLIALHKTLGETVKAMRRAVPKPTETSMPTQDDSSSSNSDSDDSDSFNN